MTTQELTQKIIDVVRKHQNEKDEYGHYKILPSMDETIDDIIKLIDTHLKLKDNFKHKKTGVK